MIVYQWIVSTNMLLKFCYMLNSSYLFHGVLSDFVITVIMASQNKLGSVTSEPSALGFLIWRGHLTPESVMTYDWRNSSEEAWHKEVDGRDPYSTTMCS